MKGVQFERYFLDFRVLHQRERVVPISALLHIVSDHVTFTESIIVQLGMCDSDLILSEFFLFSLAYDSYHIVAFTIVGVLALSLIMINY